MSNCYSCGKDVYFSPSYCNGKVPLEDLPNGNPTRHICEQYSKQARRRVFRQKKFLSEWL